MAGRKLPKGSKVVAHSDKGCQYGSRKYLEVLAALGWLSSMTEELHCYENAMAERLNGILKGEYYLDSCFRTKTEHPSALTKSAAEARFTSPPPRRFSPHYQSDNLSRGLDIPKNSG